MCARFSLHFKGDVVAPFLWALWVWPQQHCHAIDIILNELYVKYCCNAKRGNNRYVTRDP